MTHFVSRPLLASRECPSLTTEWPVKTIAECAASEPYSTQIGPFGKALMADEYTDSGVPVLRGVNVNRGRFHDDDFVFIDDETADRLSKFESFPDDVLLVHKGTLGQIGLMPRNRKHHRYIMGNSMMRVRCDPSNLLPGYLYYWLSSPQGQHYLFSRISQVGVPQIQTPLTTLRQAALPVPPLREQQRISQILGALDEKIELNRRMNETLEAMARAIFKSWFVDFDPVRAKAEGRQPFGMDAATAALFPDSFQNPPLGKIPKGWAVGKLGDLVEIIGGGTPKTSVPEFWDGDIPWYSVVDAPTSSDTFVVDTKKGISKAGLENCSATILPEKTTIISARGTVGKLALVGVPMAINQSCYALRAIDGKCDFFTYFLLLDKTPDLSQSTHGTVFDTITRDTFKVVDTVTPAVSVKLAFENAIQPLMERVLLNVKESRTLAAIRDTLLPKLISGEIRVRDANHVLEAQGH